MGLMSRSIDILLLQHFHGVAASRSWASIAETKSTRTATLASENETNQAMSNTMSNTNTKEEAMMTTNSNDTRSNDKSIDDSSSEEEELEFSKPTPEEVQEDIRRKQLQDRIPLKHFDFSKQELEDIDQGIQKRFRKRKQICKISREETERSGGR
ncbi:expressed unknown protein [Seminavis robusta]|uniref:Uncharacterized protein n=1 Tax=Seminavis robusta TaxID=568900 RepID=A0A9N8HTP0_9STRA|nr:expressed unknown protein [Seminavis robusta]|eukprot:Sro1916_g305180.1 n/a (155) ;mRNA; r:569-1033